MEVIQKTTQPEAVAVAKPAVASAVPAKSGQKFGNKYQERRPFNAAGKSDNRYGGRSRQGYGRRDDKDQRKDENDSKLLDLSRVSHTRAGGRRLRFRAIVISGNKAGKVGIGVASGLDVAQAVEKATILSKKKMMLVPIINGTISHEVIAKIGPAQVLVKPQRKGRGLMAGGVVRLICQLAGIKDISSKMLGTTKNKLNNARATMKAFEYLKRQEGVKRAVAAVSEPKIMEAVEAEK